MDCSLIYFRQFIGREFKGVCGKLDTRCADYEAKKAEFLARTGELEGDLMAMWGRFHRQEELCYHIRRLQTGVVGLLDQLLHCIGKTEAIVSPRRKESDTLLSLARVCTNALQAVLGLIAEYYPDCYGMDIKT